MALGLLVLAARLRIAWQSAASWPRWYDFGAQATSDAIVAGTWSTRRRSALAAEAGQGYGPHNPLAPHDTEEW